MTPVAPSALVAWLWLAACAPAWAVLGSDLASVQADAQRLQATRRQSTGLDHTVHTLTLPDGSTITQLCNPQGQVYLVAWRMFHKPRMAELLGRYDASYRQAAAQALQAPGLRRHVALASGDLVVRATLHLHVYTGQAQALSLTPALQARPWQR